jgi:hypothetical protein
MVKDLLPMVNSPVMMIKRNFLQYLQQSTMKGDLAGKLSILTVLLCILSAVYLYLTEKKADLLFKLHCGASDETACDDAAKELNALLRLIVR